MQCESLKLLFFLLNNNYKNRSYIWKRGLKVGQMHKSLAAFLWRAQRRTSGNWPLTVRVCCGVWAVETCLFQLWPRVSGMAHEDRHKSQTYSSAPLLWCVLQICCSGMQSAAADRYVTGRQQSAAPSWLLTPGLQPVVVWKVRQDVFIPTVAPKSVRHNKLGAPLQMYTRCQTAFSSCIPHNASMNFLYQQQIEIFQK